MNKLLKPNALPLFAAAAGIVGGILNWILYRLGVDGKGLLVSGHPLSWLLWSVTAVTLGLILLAVWKLDGSDAYEDNFASSIWAGLGHLLAGAGFVVTVLQNPPMMQGSLGTLWYILGLLSGPSLLLAGFCRVRGKQPIFVLHMIPCLFLVLHIINHYQTWSGNPQIQDYVFVLLGAMALVFFSYYTAAFEVEFGNRRLHLGMGLSAVYLCMVALSCTEYLFLYAGGALWAQSSLCSLIPKPRAPENQEGEICDDPA